MQQRPHVVKFDNVELNQKKNQVNFSPRYDPQMFHFSLKLESGPESCMPYLAWWSSLYPLPPADPALLQAPHNPPGGIN